MIKWLSIAQTLIRTVGDLHLKSGGDGPSFFQQLAAWIHSQEGRTIIADVNELLAETGVPLIIAIRGK